eukprot:TRINITY_DN3687_c0_g1_i6.p1 TRINITY_DN3687_c0_g1~~TRINITY_DN3687_c0_g1_i6.p1  ORF type:complete len:384 (-),score=79.95 TRINITY_DN3687_c0_g1_i6:101-1252(-)
MKETAFPTLVTPTKRPAIAQSVSFLPLNPISSTNSLPTFKTTLQSPSFGLSASSAFAPSASFPAPSFGSASQGLAKGLGNIGSASQSQPALGFAMPAKQELQTNMAGDQFSQQALQCIRSFATANETTDPNYPFKYIMYNRISDEQKHLCSRFQTYQSVQPDHNSQLVPVSETEWSKSVAENPLPGVLYPYQVNSWEEVMFRVKEFKSTKELFEKRLSAARSKLNRMKKRHLSEIGKAIEEGKKVNKQIFTQLISLYGLLEKVALRYNRVSKNIPSEMCLGNKLRQVEKKVEAPELRVKLNEMYSLTQELSLARDKESDVMKELPESKTRLVLQILDQQKKGIEGTIKLHKQNLNDIQVLNRELKEMGAAEVQGNKLLRRGVN